MKAAVLSVVLVAVLATQACAQGVVKKPCLEAGGAAINMSGNHGFCYLKGRRMRPDSVFAVCQDGVLTCYKDDGIPDKPREVTVCVAPEPGHCGSSADGSTPPAPSPSAVPSPAPPANSSSSNGDNEVEPSPSDAPRSAAESMDPTMNPSALAAGGNHFLHGHIAV
ncbi:hypothetical protein PINS_up001726 [Pythium insidiosum]|nr:hypothetical protein PINS_up001726 [Pythium insidiosum]